METALAFDPLLPIWMIVTLTVILLVTSMAGDVRGLKSFTARAIATFLLCGALLNPQKLLENRTPLPDIALVLVDGSHSMQIGNRQAVAQTAEKTISDTLANIENVETVIVPIGPSEDGTRLTQNLINALSQYPTERLAGVFALTDGQVHDLPTNIDELMPEGVPFHSLIIGDKNARDRRLEPVLTPKYGLVGEQAVFEVRIEDPGFEGTRAALEILLNGELKARFNAVIGNTISVPLEIEKRGINTVEVRVATAENELTPLNNFIVAEISGVRDRLRVLLITGEPHMGGRAWRNLLKSDPSVDLVQFTILTNPGKKTTNAPSEELSLIRFPDRELFEEKLNEFDLVIFDQFKRRTINNGGRIIPMLSPYYIANIADYVERGGALLIATGAAFAGEESLARSPLIAVLPARPSGEMDTTSFRPNLNEKGKRHPITQIFQGQTEQTWGRWYRTIDAEVIGGDVLMENDNGKPLLVVDKVKKGRIALLLSDQAWLWARGHDGGGPYNEMFRRLSHWLMGEPDLEADRITARIQDGNLTIEQFSLNDAKQTAIILRPDGETSSLELRKVSPGVYRANIKADLQGAYRITNGDLSVIAAAGALNPLEFKHVIPTEGILNPLVVASGGNSFWLGEDGSLPTIRKVKNASKTPDNSFAVLIDNEQYTVTASHRTPFGPGWLYFALILMALLVAWRMEGE